MSAWRDGYAEAIGGKTRLGAAKARELFDYVIATVLDPDSYAVWHVPITSGRK
jgi:hypothetical protein